MKIIRLKISLKQLASLLVLFGVSFVYAMGAKPQPNVVETGYAQTRYPIILIHGFLGSSHLAGGDYFLVLFQL
jgi:hypothetical protein